MSMWVFCQQAQAAINDALAISGNCLSTARRGSDERYRRREYPRPFYEHYPTLPRVLCVQPYAIKRGAVEHIDGAHIAFTSCQHGGIWLAADPLGDRDASGRSAKLGGHVLCLRESHSEQIPPIDSGAVVSVPCALIGPDRSRI
jgi:hypothetical protein